MCATRSRQPYGGVHRNSERDHPHPAVHPAPHPVPCPFYPPSAYPRCPSYDTYAAYHTYPSSFYPPPYFVHDVNKEEPAVWSWSTVVILFLLAIGLLVIVYRSFSRESRRKITAWLRSPRLASQTAKTQDAAQNPAEFLQCTERNGDHSPSCVDPGESSSLTDTIELDQKDTHGPFGASRGSVRVGRMALPELPADCGMDRLSST
ncbi:PREDICTED: uncharacterized protein LOC108753034 isoform X2 [Trachymyrmex septentrionalis]|uniref:uncharacterized protein LOC108753034 isoform X2 n=1 Tax=Trachymyrmex septentrionalis TaxID=34720 RepID=UPI00084EF666|nr:PREDICTED: uncharacterized protein LOC108753034 isoform X2 [Trachymyrmex septentrionalis]